MEGRLILHYQALVLAAFAIDRPVCLGRLGEVESPSFSSGLGTRGSSERATRGKLLGQSDLSRLRPRLVSFLLLLFKFVPFQFRGSPFCT